MQAADVNDEAALTRIRSARPEAVAVCAFGQLIREPLLSTRPMLNVHPSLLPRWRGAAPIERAIMAGDERTGVTIMSLTEGLDSGPIGLQEEVEIGELEDFEELSARLAELGGELLVEAFDRERAGVLELSEQDQAGVTYAEKIDSSERRLDPERTATELDRAVRALTPHIGAYIALDDDSRLGVRRARPVAVTVPAGALRELDGELLLGCAEGALRLELVQPPGGRPMPAEAYLRGHPLPGE